MEQEKEGLSFSSQSCDPNNYELDPQQIVSTLLLFIYLYSALIIFLQIIQGSKYIQHTFYYFLHNNFPVR